MTYDEIVELWKEGTIGGDKNFAELFRDFSILFSYNSGKIGNEDITFEGIKELFETGTIKNYTGDVSTIFQMGNSSEGWDFIIEKLGEREELSEDFVKDLHRVITADTYDEEMLENGEEPGEYKNNDCTGCVNEVGAFPEDVQDEMDALIDEVNDTDDTKAIVSAAYLHAQFGNIHPFADGNGRVGRLIMNYLLLLKDHPPIVIFEDDIEEYFDALRAWDDEDELKPMVEFLRKEAVKTWAEILN